MVLHHDTTSAAEHVAYARGRGRPQRVLASDRLLMEEVGTPQAHPDLRMIA
jgi:hypothetical protein